MAVNTVSDIPFVYRFVFLFFEPVAAFGGSLLLHFAPQRFLTTMSPTSVATASHQVIYDNLAATYTLFAFNEAVLLRVTNDLKIWKTVLFGILICDAIHLYASWGALGGEVFWNPLLWRGEDVVNLGSLWLQGLLRVAFVLGVGLPSRAGKGKRL
ncbi:hypothetical protein SCUP234_00656 [Seiridium cupressi]